MACEHSTRNGRPKTMSFSTDERPRNDLQASGGPWTRNEPTFNVAQKPEPDPTWLKLVGARG